jgi:hypothetical protein
MKQNVTPRNPARGTAFPWWWDALFAAVLGFGTAQDRGRALAHSNGWGFVGNIALVIGGVAVLLAYGLSAVAKLRNRRTAG